MSKRLIRLSTTEVLANVTKLQDRDVNVVVGNGQTYFGKFIGCSESILVMKDFRSHEHHLPVNSIEKIIYDQEAIW